MAKERGVFRDVKSVLNILLFVSLFFLFFSSNYIKASETENVSQGVIEISGAEHLDSGRNLIEDVYTEVKKEDGIFSAIGSEEYLRVTFSENLTNSRDITIYAEGTPGSSVEVYEKGGDRLIARFEDINSFSKYQIFLTNLSSDSSYSQNTFDLKSKGIIFYDYVVDPNESSDTLNPSEYWTFQRYLNHTSWDGVDFPRILTLSNASYTTARAITSPVSVANGFVYVSGNYDNSAIFQLNASNITQLISSFSTGGGTNPLSPITIGGGYVYASGGLTNLTFQLNASNISQQIANFTSSGVSSYFMTLVNDSLFVTTDSNSLYQLNASNISQMIANTTGTRGTAYANGFLYTNDGSDHLIQLNASNISQNFSSSTFVQYIGNPTIWNGYAYTSGFFDYIYQFNASDLSQIISSYNLGSYYFYTAPAIANGYLYTGLSNNTILQLNASNVSQVIATYTTGNGVFSSPAIANGYVYIGSNDNYTYQLNASNISQMIASYPTGNSINSAPAVANGYVYIGSDDMNIYQLCASNVSVTDGNCYFPFLTPPQISFVSPTPDSGDVTDNDYVYVNVSTLIVNNYSAWIDWDRSLAGYWPMDYYNSTGVYDNSTWTDFGTFHGNLSTSNITAGVRGDALDFDGSNSYITVPNSASLTGKSGLTISLWAKFNSLGSETGNVNIVYKSHASSPYYSYYLSLDTNDQLNMEAVNSGGTSEFATTTTTVQKDTWYHIVGVYNSSNVLSIYIDGLDVSTGQSGPISGTVFSSDSPLYLGGSGGSTLNGSLDEVQIWNRALSSQEIQALYNATSGVYNNFTNLQGGVYNYTAYAIEANGNFSSTEMRIITLSDSILPVVSLISPSNNTLNTTDNSPDFSFNVTDNKASIMTCILWLNNGTDFQYGSNSSTLNATTTTITSSVIPNGNYNWFVNCSDGINTVMSELRNISIDYAGTSYYVSNITGCSDSYIGTNSAQPWCTLTKVNNLALQPGDTVYFNKSSIWSGQQLTISQSGTSYAPITFTSYGSVGDKPTFINDPAYGSYTDSMWINADWIIIDGLKFENSSQSGIFIRPGADYNVIRNCEFFNLGTGAIIEGSHNLITENYVHDMKMVVNDAAADTDYGANGFIIYNGSNELSYNNLTACKAPSIDYGTDGGCFELSVDNNFNNVSVHHNLCNVSNGLFEVGGSGNYNLTNVTFAYNLGLNSQGFVIHNSGTFSTNVTNLGVYQNTFVDILNYSNPQPAFLWTATNPAGDDFIFRNNIVVLNDFTTVSTSTFNHTDNVYYLINVSTTLMSGGLSTNEVEADPKFVDMYGGNFNLQSDSPARNTGANLGLDFTTDMNSVSVPQESLYDMGAYEYQSSQVSGSSEWWTYRRYLNHTAWDGITFPVILTLSNTSYSVGGASVQTASPIVANGYVYMPTSWNGNLLQLNASNVSQLVSSFTILNAVESIIATNEFVYVSADYQSDDGNTNVTFQLNASNISQQIANFSMSSGDGRYSMALVNGSLFLTTNTNILYELNASNISQQIANTTGSGGVSYSDGFIYTYTGTGNMLQLNASNISQTISSTTVGQNMERPTLWNGYAYTSSAYLDRIYQFNAIDLTQTIATYVLDNYYSYTAPAIANGYAYYGLGNGTLLQLNASNVSQLIASYAAGDAIVSAPVVARGYVYFGSNDNYTYQLNASNVSQLIARYNLSGQVQSSPAFANGYIYLGSDLDGSYSYLHQLCASNISVTDGTCSFANEPWSGEYPTFSNYWDDSESLLDSGTGHFNITIENTNGTVYLNIDGQNIFAQNLSSNIYNVSYTFSSSGNFPYRWFAYGNSTNHNLGSSDAMSYTVNTTADTTYPQFSSYWDDSESLLDSGTGHLNVTVDDTNGTVLLEINGENVTATNFSSNIYNVSYTFSSGGAYSYRWYSFGNGTDHLLGSSSSRSYTVNTTYSASISTFPIGVWIQDPLRERNGQINAINYKNIGVNIFMGLWGWPTEKYPGYNVPAAQALQDNNLTAYAGGGQSAIDWNNAHPEFNSTFLGYLLGDEPDMNKVSGVPEVAAASMPDAWQAAGDALQSADTTRPVYANFGKGFALYPWGGYHIDPGPTTADDFAKYVEPVDFLSSDYYGIADPYETLNSHGIWTYGRGVDNTILWAEGKPVWGFVEGSAPFTQGTVANNINGRMPPEYIMPSVWNMIVHGAQGIIYFCHDFSDGGMVEDGCLADAGMPEAINATNTMVQSYADILLASDVSGTNSSTNGSVAVTTLTKSYNGSIYVFAMGDGNSAYIYGQAVSAAINVSGGYNRTVEVLSENRNLTMINGQIADYFDPYELHIYKILSEQEAVNITATLISPTNGISTNNPSVVFNCSSQIMNNASLENMTLYGSWNGWHANETKSLTGSSNSTNFTKVLPEGNYVWNCMAQSNESDRVFNNLNYSVRVDLTSPQVQITSPENNSNITDRYNSISYIPYDNFEVDSCWYSYDTYLVNTSLPGCSNIGVFFWNDGQHNLTIWLNDTAGNLNSSSVSFNVNTSDSSSPQFQFNSPTPSNSSFFSSGFVTLNISISEKNLALLKFNWNGTNYTLFDNDTLLFMGFDNVSSLGENQTYIADLSEYRNYGFPYNSGGLSSGGRYGGEFDFRGSDYVTVPDSANLSLTDYATWNFWIFTSDVDSCQSFISKRVGWDVANSWAMGFGFATGNASEIGFEYSSDGTGSQKREINFNKSAIPLNQWDMITFVYNSSDTQQNVRLYVNAQEVPAIHINNSNSPLYIGTSDIEIGAVNSGIPSCLFNGSMDEISILNKSLNLEEIQELYSTTLYQQDADNWGLIINQSKNAAEVLDLGRYTYYLYAQDYLGNENLTDMRSVEIIAYVPPVVLTPTTPSAGGGGGGGAAPATTITEDNGTVTIVSNESTNITIVKVIPLITPESGVTLRNLNNLTISELNISVNNETRNVMFSITRHYVKPASVTADNLSKVYAYLQFNSENLSENLSRVDIVLQIEKNWFEENVLEKEKVSLFYLNEDSNSWEELETNYTDTNSDYHYYTTTINHSGYFYVGEGLTEKSENQIILDPWMEKLIAGIANIFRQFTELSLWVKISIIIATLAGLATTIVLIVRYRIMHSV